MASLEIYDSNVWILGFTQSETLCSRYVSEAIRGERLVVLDAYVYREVFDAFGRVLDGEQHDRTNHNFATVVYESDGITIPDPDRVADLDLASVRTQPEMKLIGRLLGCQVKDAPLAVLASECRDAPDAAEKYEVTIRTTDEDFAIAINEADCFDYVAADFLDGVA